MLLGEFCVRVLPSRAAQLGIERLPWPRNPYVARFVSASLRLAFLVSSCFYTDTGEISTCPGDAHLIDNDIVARPSCPGGRVRGVLPALRLGCCVRCKSVSAVANEKVHNGVLSMKSVRGVMRVLLSSL